MSPERRVHWIGRLRRDVRWRLRGRLPRLRDLHRVLSAEYDLQYHQLWRRRIDVPGQSLRVQRRLLSGTVAVWL